MLFIQEKLLEKTENLGVLEKLLVKMDIWWEQFILRLPNIAIAILVMVLFFFLAKGLSSLLRRILRRYMRDQSMRRIISKMLYGVIILVGFFLALDIIGLNKALTSILAGAGVAALAIGLALQGTLSNTFSGIMLSFLSKIKIGDYIETDEHAGFVDEISLRNVVLRRPDNHFVIMPNSKFIEEPFVNFSLVQRARITVTSRVPYGSDLKYIKVLVSEAILGKFPQRTTEKVEFYYTEFGDSAINFMTRFWIDYVKKSQMYTAQDEAIILINDLFETNGIVIPFPIHRVELSQLKENKDKD